VRGRLRVHLHDRLHERKIVLEQFRARGEDHVDRTHRRVVRKTQDLAFAARHADRRSGFGADIRIDIAARERVCHIAETQANELHVGLHDEVGLATLLAKDDFLRRTRLVRDFLAFELYDRRDAAVLADDDAHAFVARRGDHDDRFARGRTERRCRESEITEVDGTGDQTVLAVGRAIERNDLDAHAGRHELFVELRRHRVNEFEGPDFNGPRVARPRCPRIRKRGAGREGPAQKSGSLEVHACLLRRRPRPGRTRCAAGRIRPMR